MIFRNFSAWVLGAVVLCGFAACGGDGGGGNSAGGGSTPVTPVPTMVLPGIYSAQVNGQEFWGVITPASWGSRWYGLHYAAANPDIYSGDLSGVGTASASAASLKYYQNTAASVLSGTATMKSPGASQLSGDMNLVTLTPPYKQALAFSATTPASLNYNQAAQWGDIANKWTGTLSYGLGSNTAFDFNVAAPTGAQTTGTVPGAFGVDCQWTAANSKIESSPEANMFKISLTLSISTACDFKGQTLTGIAFVQKSPVAGKSQRLMWVATTSDGKGISFKADR